jgi:organic radical activating enzyme
MSDNKLVAIWPSDKKFVNFTWQVNDICNYKCSYCNPGNYGANHKNIETDKYIQTLDKLIQNFRKQDYKYFKFFFSGGEPSIWPPLIEICKFIRASVKNSTIAINTNLSRSPDWWKKNYMYFDDVVASFHIEGCNQDVYLQNIDFLQYRLNYLACRILMHDERFQEVVDFSEKLKSFLKNGVIEYAALFEELKPHAGMHYYEDQWKRDFLKNNSYFHKREVDFTFLNNANKAYCESYYANGEKQTLNATRLISNEENNFQGWKCWINDSIFINPAGDIQLASCKMGKKIGNIHSDEIQLESEPVICTQSVCGCGTDINIRKVDPAFEKKIVETGHI